MKGGERGGRGGGPVKGGERGGRGGGPVKGGERGGRGGDKGERARGYERNSLEIVLISFPAVWGRKCSHAKTALISAV